MFFLLVKALLRSLHQSFFMIKLNPREMKNLSRILSVMLCLAPFACANAAGPVATTAGSNLTAYNPSNAYNNQWANLSNGRYDSANAPTAKADFGNCNALIMRCAQPKCSNGGCADASIASAIVTGCVQSNSNCKQYGDDLVQYMTAQLVASSTAKANEQALAAQQAAAAAAQQQSAEQMQQMQSQMMQMQQQMAQQAAESQQQLQAALEQQAAQNAAALESMKATATESAKEDESGVSAYQQDAIDRGVSADIIERQKIAGQILTEIENAETSLKEMKVSMNTAFEYAGCDARGNNCTGPKRIKKWRELATAFLDPYDNVIDKISGGLELAQLVGIDLSQIYMMLNDSCNRWGQYACPYMKDGEIDYNFDESGKKTEPRVCPKGMSFGYNELDWDGYNNCVKEKTKEGTKEEKEKVDTICRAQHTSYKKAGNAGNCRPCTLLKVLTEADEVYQGWIDAESISDNNTTVVACVSGVLNSSKLFARNTRKKNGASLIDIDKLDTWLNQVEPTKRYGNIEPWAYCDASANRPKLEKATISKNISDKELCVKGAEDGSKYSNSPETDPEICGYINSIYAICDVHPYNNGETTLSSKKGGENDCTADKKKEEGIIGADAILWAKKESEGCKIKHCKETFEVTDNGCKASNEDKWKHAGKGESPTTYDKNLEEYQAHLSEMYGESKEIIGLKTTVVSQQMYKQYEYLNATLRRLKTQLEKATLTATLQAAGAKDDNGSSSSGGLLGGNKADSDKEIVLAGAENCWNAGSSSAAYSCIQNNLNLIKSNASTNKKKAAQQLAKTVQIAGQWKITAEGTACGEFGEDNNGKEKYVSVTTNITKCANALSIAVARKIDEERKENNRYQYRPY